MDKRDFEILAVVHVEPRQSYLSLGRRVGLSAPAVRKRLMRLKRDGILTGYGLWVDPSVFGRQEVLLSFRKEKTRDQVVRILQSADVAYLGWKVEGGVTVALWTADGGSSKDDLQRTLRERPAAEYAVARRELPPLNPLAAAVVDALADDPAIPFKQLIERTGLSPKTIRKHLRALLDSETITILPKVGIRPGSGELVYHLSVEGKISTSAIWNVMSDAILLHEAEDPPAKFFLCRSPGIAEFTKTMKELGRLPGVVAARPNINRELFYNPRLVHELVERA